MGIIADITLHDPILFIPTFERVPTAICRFEDYHYLSDASGALHYVFFWWVRNCEFSAFEQAMTEDATIQKYRVVTELSPQRLYRIKTKQFPPEQPLVFPYFRENDITLIRALRTRAGLELQARFPNRDVLKAFLVIAEEIAERSSVERLYDETMGPTVSSVVTDRQRALLQLAFERGYFENPAQVTLAELSDEIDVTPQTLSTILRRGVARLVESMLEQEKFL